MKIYEHSQYMHAGEKYVNNISFKEAKEKLDYTIDELYVDVGLSLNKGQLDINIQDISLLIENGKIFIEAKLYEISQIICNDKDVIKHIDKEGFDDKEAIVIAIAELISSVITGVSPITVSALIIKKGLGKLCQEI